MKYLIFVVLPCALAFGQPPAAQAPPAQPPGAPSAPPTAAASSLAPDTVVLEVDGQKYTKADIDKIIDGLPPQIQQSARMQPQVFSQLFLMRRLAEDAVKAGLDKEQPYKDAIEFNRTQILSQAQLTTHSNAIQVSLEEEEQYYKSNPDKYRQAKVRVIYLSFNPTPASDKAGADAKKMPTDTEARAKIEDLRKQITSGADFSKLARDYSDDKGSAAKDGDFGTIKRNSPYPDAIKNAVFALKAGEVSEPIRQPNGFYLIRVDEFTQEPFNDVSMQIYQELKQQRFNQWVSGLQTQYKVKVENPDYFKPRAPLQLQPVR